MGLTKVAPFSLHDHLKELGGKFENGQDSKSFIVNDDEQLITDQNPKIFISCC